jgi:large subunit ribosomal protein L24
MKKSWSKEWNSSKQPRKQRKWRANAPLHVRQKLVSAHLGKELRTEWKRRSAPLRKGDEVKVMRGEFAGKSGKVARVDLKESKIFIEGVKRKKVSGQEVDVAIEPSNVIAIRLNVDDKERVKSLRKIAARRSETSPAQANSASSPRAPVKSVSAGKLQTGEKK